MFVAASTQCWPDLSLAECIEVLEDLDFTAIEIALHEDGQLKPSELVEDLDRSIQLLRHTHRMEISGYSVDIGEINEKAFDTFKKICHLAKTTKVVNITVPSSPEGTAFNEEVERLQKLVDIGSDEGVRVSVRCQLDCMSQDADTLTVFCNHIEGLGVALDPSVYLVKGTLDPALDKIIKFACNIYLRDSQPNAFQVSVGQGEIDYNKIIAMLAREKYDRALTVFMEPQEDLDHRVELRKLRRLLETLL
ncbi:MAG: sugar phosphate isomerase/epimerase [Planctomycetota bacterium]